MFRGESAVAIRTTAACLVVLAGCTAYVPMRLDPVANVLELESRTLRSEELRSHLAKSLGRTIDPWPLPVWDLGMLTLVSFHYNPDVETARYGAEGARAREAVAAVWPNPVLSFAPERALRREGLATPWLATVGVDVLVETAGKRSFRVDEAYALSEAADCALTTAQWRVRSRLRDALFERQAALVRRRLLEERAAVAQGLADRWRERVVAGAASAADLAVPALQAERARAASDEASANFLKSTVAVAAAIGVSAAAVDREAIGVNLEMPPRDVLRGARLATLRRRALTGRKDVLAALWEFAARQSVLQLEVARQYPDVRLGPGYNYDQGNEKWSLGVSVEIPVFDRNQGAIAQADAARREAAARFTSTQAAVLADIDTATANVDDAYGRLATAELVVTRSEAETRRRQQAVAAGAVDRIEAGAAQLDSIDARLAGLDAALAAAKAVGMLEDALQVALVDGEASRAVGTRASVATGAIPR